MNGYPSFYPRIALVAPSPDLYVSISWMTKYTDITTSKRNDPKVSLRQYQQSKKSSLLYVFRAPFY